MIYTEKEIIRNIISRIKYNKQRKDKIYFEYGLDFAKSQNVGLKNLDDILDMYENMPRY